MRPSDLLGLSEDSYTAWCVDEACYAWGTHVEHEVQNTAANVKDVAARQAAQQHRLQSLLQMNQERPAADAAGPPKGQFRDPAAAFRGKG